MMAMTFDAHLCGVAFAGKERASADRRPTQPVDQRAATNPLERLVAIANSNDGLATELATARRRLAQALAYAGDPGSRADLGAGLIDLALRKQTQILARLEANRAAALAILAEPL